MRGKDHHRPAVLDCGRTEPHAGERRCAAPDQRDSGIGPAASKSLDSHQVIRQRGLRMLENLMLDAVPEDGGELIVLSLKRTQADALPVRAMLRARWAKLKRWQTPGARAPTE